MNAAVEHYLNEYNAVKDHLPGQGLDWLDTARDEALAQFRQNGFPSIRQEDWKYTNLRAFEKHQFSLAQAVDHDIDVDTLQALLCHDMDCHLLVFIDGRYSESLSNPNNPPQGLRMRSLWDALQEDPDCLHGKLGRIGNPNHNGFTALNSAFLTDGAVVDIADNTVIERPIHMMFLSSGRLDNVAAQIRVLLLAGKNTQATVIESYNSMADDVYFNNIITEVRLEANAQIEHYKVQQESMKAFHVANMNVQQDRDSRFTSHSVSLGAQLARNDIRTVMDAENCECNLYGLYVAGGKQHVDYHTLVDHAKPHCNSNEFYKGILDGRARAVFNGQVYVHPDAQKTDAKQSNANLLLSKDAEVDTKPQLEIYADDVSCAHGATVGQLDPNMLFYLRSRGLNDSAAHALLTYGFAHDVIERMKLEPLKKHLEAILVNRIPNAEQFRDLVTDNT